MGLEPTISRTTIWRANQLHHTHHITVLGGIRTPDPRLRRPLLYPTELQTHIAFIGVLKLSSSALRKRVMGIEPTYPAWKAGVLPLNYTRNSKCSFKEQSGWQDSNLRPPGPKPGALAKLSHTPKVFFCCPPNSLARRQGILYQHLLKKSTLFLKFFLFFYFIFFLLFQSRYFSVNWASPSASNSITI